MKAAHAKSNRKTNANTHHMYFYMDRCVVAHGANTPGREMSDVDETKGWYNRKGKESNKWGHGGEEVRLRRKGGEGGKKGRRRWRGFSLMCSSASQTFSQINRGGRE